MPISADLARRFLRVNLNCASVSATEAFYCDLLGLSVEQRTDPAALADDAARTSASFLYDARGGRGGCALAAIEWCSPELRRDTNPDPTRPGTRAALFTVADLAATVARLHAAGVAVSAPIAGLIAGTTSVLTADPDGVVIALSEKPGAAVCFAGIRISTANALATAEFLSLIGFVVVEAPTLVPIAGAQLTPGGGSEPAACVRARLALPEDGPRFSVIVVQHPDTGQHPATGQVNTQGLSHCALRVENLATARAALPAGSAVAGDPSRWPLPGTRADGLAVAFLRSPAGVVFELVEHPLRPAEPGPPTARAQR